jgi:hypothetical protein
MRAGSLFCAKKTATLLIGNNVADELKLSTDCDWMRRCEKSEGQACFCTSREGDLGSR